MTSRRQIAAMAAALILATAANAAPHKVVEPPNAEALVGDLISYQPGKRTETIDTAPPVFIFRPAQIPNFGKVSRSGLGYARDSSSGTLLRTAGVGVTVSEIIRVAYDAAPLRTVPLAQMPTNLFDIVATRPDCGQRLRAELKSQLGIDARWESRGMEVLTLAWNTNAMGYKPGRQLDATAKCMLGHGTCVPDNTGSFPAPMQEWLGRPIVDPAGITQWRKNAKGHACVDIDFSWKNNADGNYAARIKRVNQWLTQRYGLELRAARTNLQMLVVKKTEIVP